MLWRHFLAIPVTLAIWGSAVKTIAQPAAIFNPHLDTISRSLPMGHTMRLPSRVQLGGPASDEFVSQLTVRVFPSNTPPGLTVGLFTCRSGPYPCLVGSFAVARSNLPNAQRELARHQAAQMPITLTQGVQGYLLEGSKQTPSYPFSSVMWEQDSMIYTVSFLAQERQNLLSMAYSMASGRPIRRINRVNDAFSR